MYEADIGWRPQIISHRSEFMRRRLQLVIIPLAFSGLLVVLTACGAARSGPETVPLDAGAKTQITGNDAAAQAGTTDSRVAVGNTGAAQSQLENNKPQFPNASQSPVAKYDTKLEAPAAASVESKAPVTSGDTPADRFNRASQAGEPAPQETRKQDPVNASAEVIENDAQAKPVAVQENPNQTESKVQETGTAAAAINGEAQPAVGKTGLEDLLPVGGQLGNRAPEFVRLANWINSGPLTMDGLQGQVVLVDFWTYTCINCINTMPALRKWHAKYADAGLVIVGVHSPEFAFERDYDNVVEHTIKYGLEYPVAQDNDFATWKAFNNRYWPAEYLIDQYGVIRYRHFGEGAYAETEKLIRKLLEETGADLSGIS